MIYTIYSEINGQIIRIVQTDNIESQLQDGESYLDGSIDDSAYYIQNGVPVAIPPKPDQYSVFDYTTKQWVQNANMAIASVSQKRQKLLYLSDWTQIPNNPLTTAQQEAWATYRQELRDIPQQSGYPFNVVWPVAPT
jgi:hypothetical protein